MKRSTIWAIAGVLLAVLVIGRVITVKMRGGYLGTVSQTSPNYFNPPDAYSKVFAAYRNGESFPDFIIFLDKEGNPVKRFSFSKHWGMYFSFPGSQRSHVDGISVLDFLNLMQNHIQSFQ